MIIFKRRYNNKNDTLRKAPTDKSIFHPQLLIHELEIFQSMPNGASNESILFGSSRIVQQTSSKPVRHQLISYSVNSLPVTVNCLSPALFFPLTTTFWLARLKGGNLDRWPNQLGRCSRFALDTSIHLLSYFFFCSEFVPIYGKILLGNMCQYIFLQPRFQVSYYEVVEYTR